MSAELAATYSALVSDAGGIGGVPGLACTYSALLSDSPCSPQSSLPAPPTSLSAQWRDEERRLTRAHNPKNSMKPGQLHVTYPNNLFDAPPPVERLNSLCIKYAWNDALNLLAHVTDEEGCEQLRHPDQGLCAIHHVTHAGAPFLLLDLMIRVATKSKPGAPHLLSLPATVDSQFCTWLPLHFVAATSNDLSTIKLLVRHYPKALLAVSRGGGYRDTPLSVAQTFGLSRVNHNSVVSLLRTCTAAFQKNDKEKLVRLVKLPIENHPLAKKAAEHIKFAQLKPAIEEANKNEIELLQLLDAESTSPSSPPPSSSSSKNKRVKKRSKQKALKASRAEQEQAQEASQALQRQSKDLANREKVATQARVKEEHESLERVRSEKAWVEQQVTMKEESLARARVKVAEETAAALKLQQETQERKAQDEIADLDLSETLCAELGEIALEMAQPSPPARQLPRSHLEFFKNLHEPRPESPEEQEKKKELVLYVNGLSLKGFF